MVYAVEQVAHKCLKMLKTVTKKLILKEPEDALETKPEIIAKGCPFVQYMTPMVLKKKEREDVKVMDIAELIANAQDL
jgi:Fe-S oxidoreductase